MTAARVLVVDNHDSFVHTLVGYLRELGADTVMRESDEIDAEAAPAALAGFDGVLVSPGPGAPEGAGSSLAVVAAAAESRTPLLGVCLGHQALAVAFGARVAQAPELMHGMTSPIVHDGSGILRGLPSPFSAARYHSLAVAAETIPDVLRVTARTPEGTVMALEHRQLPLSGVQFHPESVLTEYGYRMLATWLASLGAKDAPARALTLTPHRGARVQPAQ